MDAKARRRLPRRLPSERAGSVAETAQDRQPAQRLRTGIGLAEQAPGHDVDARGPQVARVAGRGAGVDEGRRRGFHGCAGRRPELVWRLAHEYAMCGRHGLLDTRTGLDGPGEAGTAEAFRDADERRRIERQRGRRGR